MVAPLNGHGLLHITALAPLSVVIHLTTLAPLNVNVRLRLVRLCLNAVTPHIGLLITWPLHPDRSRVASMMMSIATNLKKRSTLAIGCREKLGFEVKRSNMGNTLADFIPLGTLPHLMSRFATVIPPAGLLDVTRPIAPAPLLFGRRFQMGTMYIVTITLLLLVLLGGTPHMATLYIVTITLPLLVLLSRTPHMGTTHIITIAPPLLGLLGR
ncbi:hypothetical protein BDN67DRAFT_986310 [Paxillus ammoniavirescens]|nr:hypothetical protein BDN67DRAFT_986310 [Paxillus ammoniavirescens]